jgi:hypothetical protein
MLQRSRNEFLSMLLEVEARKHRDSHHLLGAVRTLLEGDADLVDRRHVSKNFTVFIIYITIVMTIINVGPIPRNVSFHK